MAQKNSQNVPKNVAVKPNLFGLLHPYRGYVAVLIVLALGANCFTLWLPLVASHGIDDFLRGNLFLVAFAIKFSLITFGVFVLTSLQNIVQTVVSEKVARDMRNDLSEHIARRSYMSLQELTPAKLLTNLTSDIDAIKNFVAQAIVNIVSSLFIILGVSVLLISINVRLGFAVLTIVPIIAGTFFVVLKKVRVLFVKTREVIDWLNKVINESILGAALIRILYAQSLEHKKFIDANTQARDIGLSILRLFSAMIPIITFAGNMAVLIILVFGGHLVMGGSLTLGDFSAFNSYLAILIFPILIIGFMSNIIAQAQASYGRISEVLHAPLIETHGTQEARLLGNIEVKHVDLMHGSTPVLKDVSFAIQPGTKTAIIGPTAAGKTQLLYVLVGLLEPTAGTVTYEGNDIHTYSLSSLHKHIGFVFQDSIMFNMTIRENIAFNTNVQEDALQLALQTAELTDFVHDLPKGLDTLVSERGTSLSGGQKQRIMLARALALRPKILLLDDFTARVDAQTERSILANIQKNYPDITLISVTQKIAPIEHYDQIILLMDHEVIAAGTHDQLLASCPEYVQIYDSQQSTHSYEV